YGESNQINQHQTSISRSRDDNDALHRTIVASAAGRHRRHAVLAARRTFGSSSSGSSPSSSSIARPLTVAEAERNILAQERDDDDDDPLHFSLSGTGPAMFAWMVGWCHGLSRTGLLSEGDGGRSSSCFLGLSGGSMVGAFLAAGLDLSEASDVMACGQEQSDRCREGKQGLAKLVTNMAEELITDDAASRILDGGRSRLYVAVAPAPGGGLAGLARAIRGDMVLHHRFDDRRDLVNALGAATHLPYVSDGEATGTFRGEGVVDAGIVGQMFVPTSSPGFVNVNIFPPVGYVPETESSAGRYLIDKYARWNNRANATVHAHPYDAEGFRLGVFGWDDLAVRPISKEDALIRHRLGRDAFRKWYEDRRLRQR
ncbi:hypothetical protein ACHAWF_003788, partial [Thalassiosira exigua]